MSEPDQIDLYFLHNPRWGSLKDAQEGIERALEMPLRHAIRADRSGAGLAFATHMPTRSLKEGLTVITVVL